VALAAAAAAAVAGALAPLSSAHSAGDECPAAKPVSELAAGDSVTGLTVSSGTDPDTFSGEVVGILSDGIAPGLDMIVVRLSGSVITDPDTGDVDRGVWAGMSGSPVYAEDGRLIGAVSYSIAYSGTPSDYAGVTPAEDMYAIQGHLAAAATAARKVDIEGATARRMLADPDVTQAAVAAGFTRLPMPFAVSGGLSTHKIRLIADRGGLNPKRFLAGPGAAADADPIPVSAGGNLVASASYGDISLTGTGTATAICGNEVIGFGHPMLFDGKSSLTMHGADALFIQTDNFGSFKVSQPGAPVGAISQDRLAGILGITGDAPPATTIHTDLTASNGGSRVGETYASSPDYLGYATALHTYLNLLRVFDEEGPGSDDLTWTIDLTTAGGRHLTMTRSSKFASRWDAPIEPVFEIWDDVDSIVNNRFEKVAIDDVDVTGSITDELLELSIGRVERKVGDHWTTVPQRSAFRAAAGSVIRLRVQLEPRADSAASPESVRLNLAVPAKQSGRAYGIVAGGFDPKRGSKPSSLDALLAQMAAQPGHDVVTGTLEFSHRPRTRSTDQSTAGAVVSGRFNFDVRIVR
jgi:hypothetical protein